MNRKLIFIAVLLVLVATPGYAWIEDFAARYTITNETHKIVTSVNVTGLIEGISQVYGQVLGDASEQMYFYLDADFSDIAVGTDTVEGCSYQTRPTILKNCSSPPDANILAHWPMDDDYVNNTWDAISGWNGTTQGADSTIFSNVTGKIGYGYTKDTTGYILTTSDHILKSDNAWTAMLWLKTSDSANSMGVLDNSYPSAQRTEIRLNQDGAGIITYQGGDAGNWHDYYSQTAVADNTWHHVAIVFHGLGAGPDGANTVTFYVDGEADTTQIDREEAGTWVDLGDTGVWKLGGRVESTHVYNFPGSLDDIRLFNDTLTATEIQEYYNSSRFTYLTNKVTNTDVSFSYAPTYPYVNDAINFTAVPSFGNFTDYWWNFSATNQTFHTTDLTTVFAGYGTSGSKNVTLIGFDADGATNLTASSLVEIYDNLIAVNTSPNFFLPFLFVSPVTNFSYTLTGGSPIVNSSWLVIRPDTTTESFVNQSPLEYTPTQTDIHIVSVIVCDLVNDLCVSNSTQFKPWNVTGGLHLHTPVNKSSDTLSEVFYGDSASFESPGELTWGLGGVVKVGTTATWTFNTANAFWSNNDYLHHRVTVNNSWGVYVSNQSFTVITALYNLSVGCTDFRVPYCFINADVFDLLTETQITDAGNTFNYFLTLLSGFGHANETNRMVTGASLNLSLCLNATPLISSFTLDGTIGYGATNYTSTSYAFDSADMDFVTSCSFENGHKFNLYLLPNSTTTYSTTFTFLRGGTPLEDALVKIQATLGSNWVTISSGVTDVNGKVTFPLEQCYTYYKIIVEEGTDILYESAVTCLAASECTLTTCSRVIEVDTVVQEWFSVVDGIASNCVYSEVLNYLRCTVTDTSGKGVSATLTVSTLIGGNVVCTQSETSTTTTLICETGSFFPGQYKYEVSITTDDTTYPVQSGGFTIGAPTTLGTEGPIVALAILLTLIFAVSKTHPVILIMVSSFAFVLISTLKLVSFGYATTGWIVALAGVAVVRAMTRGV